MARPARCAFYDRFRLHVYLRRPRPDGFHQVRIVCYFHGTDFSVSPGLLILPERKKGRGMQELFEPKTGRVLADHPEAEHINEQLGLWEKRLRAAFRSLAGPLGSTQVTRAALEQAVFAEPLAEVAAPPGPAELRMAAHYVAWQQENAGLYSATYLNAYQHVVDQLEQWRPGLLAGQLTETLVRDWRRQLVADGAADGSIVTHYKFFRLLLQRLGQPTNVPWLRHKTAYAPQLDLTADEVRGLLVVRLEDARLAEERDRWLLQLLCGRRAGDMRQLTRQQLATIRLDSNESVPALQHLQHKTGAQVLLPLPPLAMRIGQRWQWQLPDRNDGQRNRAIKEVARLAGLDRLFHDVKISNGQATGAYRPVHELISTHTARHTAGSLLLEFSGGDKSLAAYALGHAQEGPSSTDIYAKDKARRVAGPILQAWQQILAQYYDADPPGWVDAPDGGPLQARQNRRKIKKPAP